MFPFRFATGIRNKTIPNPCVLHADTPNAKLFQGQVGDYDFKRQTENFNKLQAVLRANGTELGPIVAAEFDGYYGYEYNQHPLRQTRFVIWSKDGSLMWEKYAANSSAGNQNDVYVGGKKMHLTDFLGRPDYEQRALLGGNPSLIAVAGIS